MVLISSVVVILILSGTLIRGGAVTNWKDFQKQFIRISEEIEDSLNIPTSFEKGIYQVELDHFNRIDRCISCHNGLENPMMSSKEQPQPCLLSHCNSCFTSTKVKGSAGIACCGTDIYFY